MWLLRLQREPKFGRWVALEEQKNRILKAVGESSDEFPNELFTFLSTALHLSHRHFRKASWIKVVQAFYKCLELTRCQFELPIFEPNNVKIEDVAWDYHNRPWHVYVHMLAKEYGWTIEYIYNLSIKDAMCAIQEILLDDQLEKEFQWTMSERSAYYDDKSKTTKLNPLPRPQWMMKHVSKDDLPKIKIPVGMMPTGAGITQDELIAQASKSQ